MKGSGSKASETHWSRASRSARGTGVSSRAYTGVEFGHGDRADEVLGVRGDLGWTGWVDDGGRVQQVAVRLV